VARITGHEYPISKIFSAEFDFSIPPYQRPYAWTTEEAGELLNDIREFMQEQSQQGTEEPYFLGSIVLIKAEDLSEAQVIDGQQRLTTLTILLALLSELTAGDVSRSLKRYVNEPGDPIEGREPSPRLSLRERDREFFARYVQQEGGLAELERLPDASLTDSQKNMRDNAQLYRGALEKLDQDYLVRLAKFVATRCYLVAVSTPSMESAYRIFSVLNDRGLDLLPGDILKAEIIGSLAPGERDAYTRKWEDLEDQLGRDSFNELFPHIRMIYQRDKLRMTILDAFRKQVLPAFEDRKRLIDDVLGPYADAYSTVTNSSFRSTEGAKEVNEILKWLNQIDNFDWVPPAMEYLRRHADDPEALALFFRALERLAVSMLVRRQYVNARIERYGTLLRQIQDDADLFADGSALMLSEDERFETLSELDGDVYGMNVRTRRYVMLRLDSFLSDRGATYDVPVLTVEHVLPQTVSAGSEWERVWTSQELRERSVHRIGNLVLLTRRKNSQAGNLDFAEKKRRYFLTSEGVTTFAATTKVLEHEEWSPEIVEARQKELLKCFERGWDLS